MVADFPIYPSVEIVVLGGLLPMLIWTAFLWWLDHWEREPWYLIAAAFLWGAVPSTLLALVAQQFLMIRFFPAAYFYDPRDVTAMAVVVAPVTEEILKALALLLLFLFRRREIDSLLDGLIYGAAVGFGFAATENIIYFLPAAREMGYPGLAVLVVLRAFMFGTSHAIFTGLTGLGFALARFRTDWVGWLGFPLLGLLAGIFLHGLHNLLVTLAEFLGASHLGLLLALFVHGIGFLGAVALFIASLIIQRRWIRHHLEEEVERGVLTRSEAEQASALAKSWGIRGEQRRFNRLAVELALKKHARSRVGEKGQSIQEIENIRKRLVDLRQEMS